MDSNSSDKERGICPGRQEFIDKRRVCHQWNIEITNRYRETEWVKRKWKQQFSTCYFWLIKKNLEEVHLSVRYLHQPCILFLLLTLTNL